MFSGYLERCDPGKGRDPKGVDAVDPEVEKIGFSRVTFMSGGFVVSMNTPDFLVVSNIDFILYLIEVSGLGQSARENKEGEG